MKDVARLALDHEDDRVVSEVRVRPVCHEEVREAGDRDSQVGLGTFLPFHLQRSAFQASDLHGCQEFGAPETCGQDDSVSGMSAALAIDNPVLAHALDPCGHDLDVLSLQRRIVVIGDEDAAGSYRVVRNQGRLQLRVRDDAPHVLLCHALEEPAQPGSGVEDDRVTQLEIAPDPPPVELCQPGMAREAVDLLPAIGTIHARDHPVGAALKHGQVLHLLGDLRDELDGAGRVADNRSALAREVVFVVPARRVELLSPEVSESRDVRHFGAVQLPDGADQHLCLSIFPSPGPKPPHGGGFVEVSGHDLRAEPDVRHDAVLLRAVVHVGEKLVLAGPLARPVGLLLEGEAVRECGDIAGGPRIRVVTPGTAQAVGLLEDRERVDASLLQLNAEANARKAGADDGDTRPVAALPDVQGFFLQEIETMIHSMV